MGRFRRVRVEQAADHRTADLAEKLEVAVEDLKTVTEKLVAMMEEKGRAGDHSR